MLDPQLFRTDIQTAATALAKRGYTLDVDAYQDLEGRRKDLQQRLEELQSKRNRNAKAIGHAKAKGEDIQPLLDQVSQLGDELGQLESEFRAVRDEQLAWHLEMPNIADQQVPPGNDEADNIEIRQWGSIPEFEFEPRDHVELGQRRGLLTLKLP